MEDRDIVRLFIRLTVAHRYEISQAANSVGIYLGQPRLLEYVMDNDNCTQNELSEKLRVSPPSVAMSVKRLQKAGLLKKVPDQNDLRRNRLTITREGSEALKRYRSACCETDKKLFSGFTESEKEQLISFLIRMTNNITNEDIKPETINKFLMHEFRRIEEDHID